MVSPFTIASRRAEDDRPEIRIRVEIDSESTGDFPRESLARIAVNYAPSAVMVLGFVVYTAVASYLWLHATYSWIGGWTLLPVGAVSVSALVALVAFGRRVRAVVAAGISVHVQSVNWTVIICRIACILWHLLLALLSILSVILIVREIIDSNYQYLVLIFTFLCGWGYFVQSVYLWYWRCWYEKAIIAQNEELYGPTIFVSIPVFKLCGHFILVVNGHKYELRLDPTTRNRPTFNERLLHPGEAEEIRSAFGHHWFIVGWTRRTHEEINAAFTNVIQSFGAYNRTRNNCRHFLQEGCLTIMDSASTWHEDMLMAGAGLDMVIVKMGIVMWRSVQRDLYRWIWTYWYGPEWENRAVSEFHPSAMLEDLLDHDYEECEEPTSPSEPFLRPHERVLNVCCPWIAILISYAILISLVSWMVMHKDQGWQGIPTVLLVGTNAVLICISGCILYYMFVL